MRLSFLHALLATLVGLLPLAVATGALRTPIRPCQAPASQPASGEGSGAAPAPDARADKVSQKSQKEQKKLIVRFRGKRYPATVAAALALKAAGRSFSNGEIRRFYQHLTAQVPRQDRRWRRAGKSALERARLAYGLRKHARVLARAMMASEVEVAALRARDEAKYGQADGPTFEQLVEKGRKRGLEGDALYESILSSARRTNKQVDRRMKVRSEAAP